MSELQPGGDWAFSPGQTRGKVTMMPTTFSAVLLAAGHSRRMGADKALLRAEGQLLWARQCALLREAGAKEVFLSVRPAQLWAADPAVASHFEAVIHDVVPGCGPLGGIASALQRSARSHLAVLAIDLPAMPVAWFRTMAEHAEAAVGVVGLRDGFFEPLAALYPRELTDLARAALATGDYSLQRWLASAVARGLMRVREISPPEAAFFKNWNEPDVESR